MQLVLEVKGRQASRMGGNRVKVITHAGGRIGRDPDNDWVIADDYVSGHHATIRFLNGMFFIEHHGSNLTAVNDRSRRLDQGGQELLSDGDTVFIDEYEIGVRIVEDNVDIELPVDDRISVRTSGSNGLSGDLVDADALLSLLPNRPKLTANRLHKESESISPGEKILGEALNPAAMPDQWGRFEVKGDIDDDWFQTRNPKLERRSGLNPEQTDPATNSTISATDRPVSRHVSAPLFGALAAQLGFNSSEELLAGLSPAEAAECASRAMPVAIKNALSSLADHLAMAPGLDSDDWFSSDNEPNPAEIVSRCKAFQNDPDGHFARYFAQFYREALIEGVERLRNP